MLETVDQLGIRGPHFLVGVRPRQMQRVDMLIWADIIFGSAKKKGLRESQCAEYPVGFLLYDCGSILVLL